MKKLKLYILFPVFLSLLVLAGCQEAHTPEPSATVDDTYTRVENPTASPTPEIIVQVTPTSQTQVPPIVFSSPTASQVVVTAEGTVSIPAAGTTPIATTPVGPYPGPNAQITLSAVNTVGPYPGPQQTASFPQQTQPPSVSTVTVTPGLVTTATGTLAVPTATSTQIPTPGLVQTELRATDPENFTLASGNMQLVEFFAFWSPVSKSMAPVMYSLEQKYRDQIGFVYLDIDDPANGLYRTLLGDRLPPVFFVLDGQGNVMAEFQGYVKPEEFEAAFVLPQVQPTQAPHPTP